MPRCDRWFLTFAAAHQERFPRDDWEGDDSAFWETWRDEFDALNVTESEANEASKVLARKVARREIPPLYVDSHLPTLIGQIKTARSQQGASPGSREEAFERSKGCVECAGGGLTRRFTPTRLHPNGAWLSFACHRCDMGRWMLQASMLNEATRGRLLDLREFPRLHHVHEPEPGEHLRWCRDSKTFLGAIGKMPTARRPDPNDERNRQLEYLEHRKRVADFSSPPPF
jgi:hypothetical protein